MTNFFITFYLFHTTKKNSGIVLARNFYGNVLTWIEIDQHALKFNIKNFRKIIKKTTKFYAVVKSNAYGHGIKEIVRLIHSDIDGFCINHISEVNDIYELTDKPVMIMGGYDEEDLKALLDKDLTRISIVVSNENQLKMIKNIVPNVPFYIKVDTGMSRLGYRSDSKNFVEFLNILKDYKNNIKGLMSHFSNVEDVTDQSYAYEQLKSFQKAKEIVRTCFPDIVHKFQYHIAASAATMLIPESHQDIVRIGISLYGLWPSLPTKLSTYNIYKDQFQLKPVLTWKTRIVHINEVPENSMVGYGCTFQTSYKTRIAVLPVGYYEGYDRSLSNRSFVIVRNRRAMLLGRVCMNMIMIDVTHIPDIQVGDEVILIGSSISNQEQVTADDLAEIAGTINYEITTRIPQHIKRIIKA